MKLVDTELDDFKKDEESRALLNTNENALKAYRKKRQKDKERDQVINNMKEEINTLNDKIENMNNGLEEIKNLLKG